MKVALVAALGVALVWVGVGGTPSARADTPTGGYTGSAIRVGHETRYVAVDSHARLAYVAGVGTVTIIDTTTNRVVKTVSIKAPSTRFRPLYEGIALDLKRHRAYISDYGNAQVVVFSLTAQRQIARVSGVPNGGDVAIDDVTGTVYVPSQGTLKVIHEASDRVVSTISLPRNSSPEGLVFDPATKRVLLADHIAGVVDVVDPSKKTVSVSARVAARFSLSGIALDPVRRLLYVTASHEGEILVMDTGVRKVTARIGGLLNAQSIGLDPVHHRLFVGENEYSATAGVVDSDTNTVLGTVPLQTYSMGLAVDQTSGSAYLSGNTEGSIDAVTPPAP